ncbi:hypothetical protein [Cyclobacterium roseum]|uniref:hypothetical protein n=1 Tax=Cyclobacterium roseum TaxID=2666137 RepID=UPI001391D15E|nr:hypothetical protein [Cyclobacterium roseum]
MKPLLYLFILVSIPFRVLAQEVANESSLAGAWELDLGLQIQALQKQGDNKFTAMPPPVQEMFLASLETRKYIFYPDGRFEAYWLLGGKSQMLSGTWKMKNAALHLSHENGPDRVYKLSKTGEVIILVSKGNTGNVLQTLYLKREGL